MKSIFSALTQKIDQFYSEYFATIWQCVNENILNFDVISGLKKYCDARQLAPPHDFVANMQEYATGNSFISRYLKELYQQWLTELGAQPNC